jgi:hypothetical protein
MLSDSSPVREAFEAYWAGKKLTPKQDRIVIGCLAGNEARRERSKLVAAARGDSDEKLELVCTRQPDGQTQQCGGTTSGILTASLVCRLCKGQSYGYHHKWAMKNGSQKPKPVMHFYECIDSGTIRYGPHGKVVPCCQTKHALGMSHFKEASNARQVTAEASKARRVAEASEARQVAATKQKARRQKRLQRQ